MMADVGFITADFKQVYEMVVRPLLFGECYSQSWEQCLWLSRWLRWPQYAPLPVLNTIGLHSSRPRK